MIHELNSAVLNLRVMKQEKNDPSFKCHNAV